MQSCANLALSPVQTVVDYTYCFKPVYVARCDLHWTMFMCLQTMELGLTKYWWACLLKVSYNYEMENNQFMVVLCWCMHV